MGSWLFGKSSLTTRDPHIPSAGVGSFVGIVTKWTQGNRMVKKAHVCPALSYLVDGTILASGLGTTSLFPPHSRSHPEGTQ